MLPSRWHIPALLLSLLACHAASAQTAPVMGTLEVSGRVKIGAKTEQLKRKRFYLIRGGLTENKALIDRLKAADVTSRECFYCKLKASPEYSAWLKAGDCESPYCREITSDDIAKVPEFQLAFQKGMKQYRGKEAIARQWLTTNLLPDLRDGFYRQRRSMTESLLAGIKPLQSSMTDSVSVKAIFFDIPVKPETAGKPTETFLITNIVPIEIGSKSYVWACEKEIGSKKVTLQLPVPENNKPAKNCEVIVRDLPDCSSGTCAQK